MNLSEKDTKLFKKWLKSHLKYGPVTVVFTKKDGEERSMLCTLNEDLISKVEIPHATGTNNPIDFPGSKTPAEEKLDNILKEMPKKEKKVNDNVLPVYALDVQAWRSFRWDSIKSVSFTLGEE